MRYFVRLTGIQLTGEKSIYLPLILCSLVFLFGIWFHSDIFLGSEPRSYHIQGNHYLTEDEILALFPLHQKDYPIEKIETDIKKNPRVQSVLVNQEGRFQFTIQIQEKEPFLLYQYQNHIYELDQEFVPISMDDVRATGGIVFTSNIHPEQKTFLKIQIHMILNELKLIPSLENKISEIEFDGEGNFTIYLFEPQFLKVELGKNISRKSFQKLRTSIAYIEKNKLSYNRINLKGEEAILYTL